MSNCKEDHVFGVTVVAVIFVCYLLTLCLYTPVVESREREYTAACSSVGGKVVSNGRNLESLK